MNVAWYLADKTKHHLQLSVTNQHLNVHT